MLFISEKINNQKTKLKISIIHIFTLLLPGRHRISKSSQWKKIPLHVVLFKDSVRKSYRGKYTEMGKALFAATMVLDHIVNLWYMMNWFSTLSNSGPKMEKLTGMLFNPNCFVTWGACTGWISSFVSCDKADTLGNTRGKVHPAWGCTTTSSVPSASGARRLVSSIRGSAKWDTA